MTAAPGCKTPGPSAPRPRPPKPREADAIQAVWEASAAHDDPASWPRGGWSVTAWATDSRVLEVADRLVGVAAVRAEPDEAGVIYVRLALAPQARQTALAEALVGAAVELTRSAGAHRARLWLPDRATWAIDAARLAGFASVRGVAHMLLPADAPTPSAAPVPGLRIRSIALGEEADVLAALNRAWAGTWGFVPIPLGMLEEDLAGQREGMLLGSLDPAPAIIATCHAVYEPAEQNPDGQPRAWISNLTVDPAYRQRGIARAMLVQGISFLRARGAASVTLGVDAGDPAPLRLYLSAGFAIVSRQEAWEIDLHTDTDTTTDRETPG